MDLFFFGEYFDFILYQFLDAFFTGLMVLVVIVITISLLRVRGVTFRVDVDDRDKEDSE